MAATVRLAKALLQLSHALPGWRNSLAIASLASIALVGCEGGTSAAAPLNAAGMEVADSFVRAVIAGDGETAARLRIPGVLTTDVREFAEENAQNDLRVVGPPEIDGNRVVYQVAGREFLHRPTRVRASLGVWMVKTYVGWRVSDWWYHIRMRTFIDEEAPTSEVS